MSYAVQSDLLTRITPAELTQLTDDAGIGAPNATTVQANLDRATALIDSYCRARYQTPLQTSNTATEICIDLSVYFLFTRRPQKMRETVRQSYEDAIAFLKDISTGKASLDQPAGAPTPQTSTASAVKPQHSHLRFGGHNLEGWD
jgi:phage gp36-like protein